MILRKAAANVSPDTSPTNRASTSFPPIRALSPAPTLSNLELLIFLHSDRSRLMKAANKHFRIKKGSMPHSPISLSDLLSISVSVSVSAELERLERHEFCPDIAPVPQRAMVRSGDAGSWFSVATGPLE